MYAVSTEEVEHLARAYGMSILNESRNGDQLGRGDISWVTLVLKLPDDGTGALPLLRHVILNDAKSSTYKLGLLRALARAADGSQGLARNVGDERVVLPLGLIALNWLRLYKPLVEADLPQTPTNRGIGGLGFAGEAWAGVQEIPAIELRVGARLSGERAHALHRVLRDCATTITRMPATYITYPGTSEAIFPARRFRTIQSRDVLELDEVYLWSFGELSVPLHLWRAFVRFDAWIEPALVSEWVRVMESYAYGQGRSLDPGEMARAMHWHNPQRGVGLARQRAALLMEDQSLFCVWTGRRLFTQSIDIDHCLPWSVWPCDDLWNLLPANPKVNRHGKRDKLPSAEILERSAERIKEWWHLAWMDESLTRTRFLSEAQASLPPMPLVSDLDAVFAAVQSRRFAIRADQQVPEWDGL